MYLCVSSDQYLNTWVTSSSPVFVVFISHHWYMCTRKFIVFPKRCSFAFGVIVDMNVNFIWTYASFNSNIPAQGKKHKFSTHTARWFNRSHYLDTTHKETLVFKLFDKCMRTKVGPPLCPYSPVSLHTSVSNSLVKKFSFASQYTRLSLQISKFFLGNLVSSMNTITLHSQTMNIPQKQTASNGRYVSLYTYIQESQVKTSAIQTGIDEQHP